MIDLKVKNSFFDRKKVQLAMDKATNDSMRRSASSIRKRAQTSMRYVTAATSRKNSGKPYTPSRPGEPPRAVRPHPFVRKFLFFSYNAKNKNAVIGPEGFSQTTNAPHNLEFGGVIVVKNNRRRIRKLGDGGEIRIGGRPGGTTKEVIGNGGTRKLVSFCILRTQKQVARANELNEQIYGSAEIKKRAIAPRPFMGPALAAEAGNMPRRWLNSVKG